MIEMRKLLPFVSLSYHAIDRHLGLTEDDIYVIVNSNEGCNRGVMSSFNHDLRITQLKKLYKVVLSYPGLVERLDKFLSGDDQRQEFAYNVPFNWAVGFAGRVGSTGLVECKTVRVVIRKPRRGEREPFVCTSMYPLPVGPAVATTTAQKTPEVILERLSK